jgi:hypothetical protein
LFSDGRRLCGLNVPGRILLFVERALIRPRGPVTPSPSAQDFTDALATLDAEQWLAIGHSAQRDAVRRRAALHSLEEIVATADVRLLAWRIRGDIETAACYAFPSSRRPSDEVAVQVAIGVAESAALAILVRPLLSEPDFDALYSPFTGLDLD